MDNVTIEDLIKEVRAYTNPEKRKFVTFQQNPFYGEVTICLFEGKRTIIRKVETVK